MGQQILKIGYGFGLPVLSRAKKGSVLFTDYEREALRFA